MSRMIGGNSLVSGIFAVRCSAVDVLCIYMHVPIEEDIQVHHHLTYIYLHPPMANPLLPRVTFFRSLASSQVAPHVSPELLQSASSTHINPRGHALITDTISQVFPREAIPELNDEQLLSNFTFGFFGGFVFGPERLALRLGAWRFLPVTFTGTIHPPSRPSILTSIDLYPDPKAQTVWNAESIPRTHLLPVGSRLFGAFVVLDKHIASASDPRPSYVDYAFGSDQRQFAGCHRFQIQHGQGSQPSIQIDQQHLNCNPQENIPAVPEYGQRLHTIYAKLLFANGIQCLEDQPL